MGKAAYRIQGQNHRTPKLLSWALLSIQKAEEDKEREEGRRGQLTKHSEALKTMETGVTGFNDYVE